MDESKRATAENCLEACNMLFAITTYLGFSCSCRHSQHRGGQALDD